MTEFKKRQRRYSNTGMCLLFLTAIGVLITLPAVVFLILAIVALPNGIFGYVSGRLRTVKLAVLGPTLLLVGSQLYCIINSPYDWPRSGPPGTYSEWWALAVLIPTIPTAYGSALLMCSLGMYKREWPGRCKECDYNLYGLREPRCPECGTPFDMTATNLPAPK